MKLSSSTWITFENTQMPNYLTCHHHRNWHSFSKTWNCPILKVLSLDWIATMNQGRIPKTQVMGRCSALHQHLFLWNSRRMHQDLSGKDLLSPIVVHREGEEDQEFPSVWSVMDYWFFTINEVIDTMKSLISNPSLAYNKLCKTYIKWKKSWYSLSQDMKKWWNWIFFWRKEKCFGANGLFWNRREEM